MFVQVDADILAYSIGHKFKDPDRPWLLKSFIKNKVDGLLQTAMNIGKINELVFYLTSNDRTNYRFGITEDYKANRTGKPKPQFYNEVRDFIMEHYNAEIISGMEADDRLSINAWNHYNSGKKGLFLTISSDKDCRQFPGLHYEMGDAPIYEVHMPGYLSLWRRSSSINVFGTGLAFFYYQLLAGDKIDNIPKTISSTKAYHTINNVFSMYGGDYETIEHDFYESVRLQYEVNGYTKDDLIQNARLLHLKHSEDEPLWEPPV